MKLKSGRSYRFDKQSASPLTRPGGSSSKSKTPRPADTGVSSNTTVAAPSATTLSAATRVFGIVELLENILLHFQAPTHLGEEVNPHYNEGFPVDMQVVKTLYSLLRVNHNFAATIRGSPSLRQRMLLDPPPVTPLCRYQFSAVQLFNQLTRLNGASIRADAHCSVLPCLNGNFAVLCISASLAKDKEQDEEDDIRALECLLQDPRSHGPLASWREMLILKFDLQQPLTFEFDVRGKAADGRKRHLWTSKRKFASRDSLTLGDFHDFCVEVIEKKKKKELSGFVMNLT